LTYEVKNPHQNTGYSGVVLLGTSQAKRWSTRRLVAVERIGDEVAIHDISAAVGQNNWVRYPLLTDDGPTDHGTNDLQVLADSISESVSNVLMARQTDKKSCEFADRLRDLMVVSPGERLISASQRLRGLSVERIVAKDSSEGRWLLSSDSPRTRIHVAAAPDDIAEVEERLSRLVGS
jgi:hypothetical protein